MVIYFDVFSSLQFFVIYLSVEERDAQPLPGLRSEPAISWQEKLLQLLQTSSCLTLKKTFCGTVP